MRYRIIKYRKKRDCPFETYKPKKKVDFSKEETLPLLIRIGHSFVFLGGLMGFWASSILMGLKGFFIAEKKVKSFSLNNKVVELRIKK